MNTPTALIVTAASKPGADAIGEALGLGPGNFFLQLTTDTRAKDYDANVQGPFPGVVTHYGAMFSVIEKSYADLWLSIANGILPEDLPGTREWGVDGVISYADALAAVTPTDKLKCYLGSDNVTAYDMFWGNVAGWRDASDPDLRLYAYPLPTFG